MKGCRMILKKSHLILLVSSCVMMGALSATAAPAATVAQCQNDATQIQTQIDESGGGYITTTNCPPVFRSNGLAEISGAASVNSNGQCSSACNYQNYRGSTSTCTWVGGNWGNTLACT